MSLLTASRDFTRSGLTDTASWALGPPHEFAGTGAQDYEGREGSQSASPCPTSDPGSHQVARSHFINAPPVSASLMLVAFPRLRWRVLSSSVGRRIAGGFKRVSSSKIRRRSAGSGNGITGDGRAGVSISVTAAIGGWVSTVPKGVRVVWSRAGGLTPGWRSGSAEGRLDVCSIRKLAVGSISVATTDTRIASSRAARRSRPR